MTYSLDATYYRTGLLLGLIQGEEVQRWAERVIELEAVPRPEFLELVSVPAGDLSGLRHALWPLVTEPDPPGVLRALLALLHDDLASGRRSLHDTMTVLRQMRSMVQLSPGLYSELNAVFVQQADVKTAVPTWLARFAGDRRTP